MNRSSIVSDIDGAQQVKDTVLSYDESVIYKYMHSFTVPEIYLMSSYLDI